MDNKLLKELAENMKQVNVNHINKLSMSQTTFDSLKQRCQLKNNLYNEVGLFNSTIPIEIDYTIPDGMVIKNKDEIVKFSQLNVKL